MGRSGLGGFGESAISVLFGYDPGYNLGKVGWANVLIKDKRNP